MTNNIYPPDHLLRKRESLIIDEEQNVDVVLYEAFQAGADQELEACCEWVSQFNYDDYSYQERLRAARRSTKPPSLKAQALALIDECTDPHGDYLDNNALAIIRRAIESLPD